MYPDQFDKSQFPYEADDYYPTEDMEPEPPPGRPFFKKVLAIFDIIKCFFELIQGYISEKSESSSIDAKYRHPFLAVYVSRAEHCTIAT